MAKEKEKTKEEIEARINVLNYQYNQAAAKYGQGAQSLRSAEAFIKRTEREQIRFLDIMDSIGTEAEKLRKLGGIPAPETIKMNESAEEVATPETEEKSPGVLTRLKETVFGAESEATQ